MNFCITCGRRVERRQPAAGSQTWDVQMDAAAEPLLRCTGCGTAVASFMKFCTGCGLPLKPAEAPVAAPVPERAAAAGPAAYAPPADVRSGVAAPQVPAGAGGRQPHPVLPAERAVRRQPAMPPYESGPARPSGRPRRAAGTSFFRRHKLALIIGAASLCFVAVVVALLFLFGGIGRAPSLGEGVIAFTGSDVIIPVGGKPVHVEGKIWSVVSSRDPSRVLVMSKKESFDDVSFLYYVSGTSAELISEKTLDAVISASGEHAAVVQQDGRQRSIAYYTGGRLNDLDTGADSYAVTISPDGRTIAYAAKIGETIESYLWDGSATKLDEDIVPFIVSDGARHLYFVSVAEMNNDWPQAYVYVQERLKEQTRQKIIKVKSLEYFGYGAAAVQANRDLSEIMFTNGETTVFVRNNKVEKETGKRSLVPLLPSVTASWAIGTGGGDAPLSFRMISHDIGSLTDHLYYQSNGESIVYLDGSYETRRVVSKGERARLDSDGKTLYYQVRDALYKIDSKNAGAAPEQLVRRDVSAFYLLDNGDLYYQDDRDSLYYLKGREGVYVDDVDYASLYPHTNKLFVESRGTVYAAAGGRLQEVREINDDIRTAGQFGCTLAFVSEYEDQIFYTGDGGKVFNVNY